MSQPASPVGSVEFIVKFDSMQSGFVDALKEAMKDVEIETGADPQLTNKIDEILDNLRNRLRGIWTGNRQQFLATAVADIRNNQDIETIKNVARDVIIGQGILKKEEEQTPEEFQAKAEDLGKKYLQNWSLMIQKAIEDKAYWEKMKDFIITHQARIHAGLNLGRWPSQARKAFKQIIKEFSIEEKFKEKAKEEKFPIITQKGMAPTPLEIDITEGEGPKKKITDWLELADAMSKRGVSKEEMDKAMSLVPGPGLRGNIMIAAQDLLKDYIIAKESDLPNIFHQTWRKMQEVKALGDYPIVGGTRPDISFSLENTLESLEKFRKVYESAGFAEKEIKEMIDEAREAFGLKTGQPFGTKVEGMAIEVEVSELSTAKKEEEKAKADIILEKLKKLKEKKLIAGLSPEGKKQLEEEEADWIKFKEDIRVGVKETVHQSFKMFVRDFKADPSYAELRGLLAKSPEGMKAITPATSPNLIDVASDLRNVKELLITAQESSKIEKILNIQELGRMLKEALETKNVDLIRAIEQIFSELTPEQRSKILKE